ncbi:MAG TPA: CARDB domain-containing protein [Vicinamibacterales bacterium]|nr:CARDB domain-containing protein [Vicinamibacterales bacterium]
MISRSFAGAAAITGAVAVASLIQAQVAARQGVDASHGQRIAAAVKHDVSKPLRSIRPIPPQAGQHPSEREPRPRHAGRGLSIPVDTVVQNFFQNAPTASAPLLSIDGLPNVNNVLPPDTNGDVGPNHYVQWVNLSFAIYGKGTGGAPPVLLYGPAAGRTLWAGFGGPCESTDNGDPIVLYDHLADRWVMTQLSLPNMFFGLLIGPFYQCIAVSATSDPLGAYYRYQYSFDKLNDYPKLAVWPDGYYMTMNQYTAVTLQFAGQGVAAFDRASMLAGQPANMIYFDLDSVDPNLGGMLPADLDGRAPPPQAPALYAQIDDDAWGYAPIDQIQVWRFHADWANLAASTFTRAAALATAPFDSDMCAYSRNCIAQPGTGTRVDAMADRLMYRVQYRNFADHESIVLNHTVDADGTDHAGIRWYEIRDPEGTPFIAQQGTYAPDGDNRWMASAAMDGAGNLAIGFSVSSASTAPSVRYTGRLASDPPGLMTQGEMSLIEGAGAQTDSSGRWGDYSMLAVDPLDDCTFWYTQLYYANLSGSGWRTRIGAFSLPSCDAAPSLPAVTIVATDPAATEAGPAGGMFTVTRAGDTADAMLVHYTVSGSATPDVDYAALPGTILIPSGAASATIPLTPIDDNLFEPDETVLITIASDPAYRAGLPSSAVVTITSDELAPDLIVSAVSAPAAGGIGADVTITETTRNQGAGPAGPSATAFYLSTNTSFDASDVRLGSRQVPSLAPGGDDTASTALTIPASTSAGTYYVIAVADDNTTVAESTETNNARGSDSIRLGADLSISSVVAPSSAALGGVMSLSDTTLNSAGGAAPATKTRFYLTVNATLEASDPEIGVRNVPALAPGASSSGTIGVTVPSNTAPGLYYVIAKADADGVVSEINEGNNTRRSSAVRIGPDLVVTAVGVPTAAGAGDSITISDSTKNQGAGTAPPSATSFFLSTNLTLDAADIPLGSRAVPSIAAGATNSGSVSLQIPGDTDNGSYFVLAKADGGETVAENNESNNVKFSSALRVGPDLIVTSVSAPASAGPGSTITVTDTTKDAGAGPAPASTTSFYLSTNSSLDAGDRPLGSRGVPALAGGVSSTGSTSVTIPVDVTTGQYFVLAVADGINAIAESQEGNNVDWSGAIRVGSDLTTSGVSVPSVGASGGTIVVTETTTNAGSGSAPASTTALFLSTNVSFDASDIQLGARAVPALAPGTSSTGSTTVTLPGDLEAGTYYVLAKADGPDAIEESNESNNTSSDTIAIGPDLTIPTVSYTGTPVAGGTVTIIDTIVNSGGGAAAPSTTLYYLSTNLSRDAGDVLLGSRTVGPLAAGASNQGSAAVVLPAGTAAGGYYILAIADGDGLLPEANEANNGRVKVIWIKTP